MVGLNTSRSGMPPNWVRWMKAGQATAIVDAQGRGDFPTVQAGVDAVEAIVKAGQPAGGIWVRAGVYRETVTIAQNDITLMGESRDSLIDGGLLNALTMTGTRVAIYNMGLQTTAGGGTYAIGIAAQTGTNGLIQNCYFPDGDHNGIQAGMTGLQILGCYINDADNMSIQMSGSSTNLQIVGNYLRQSMLASASSNFQICSNGFHDMNATGAITLNAGCDDGIVDGNIIDGTITNNGSGSTVGDNELY